MPKRIRMLAEVIGENCTGCSLCVQVCPTVALGMRDRRPDEPGPGRKIAELDPSACYNAQTCLEICPDHAIVMRQLDPPFDVGHDLPEVPAEEIAALCARAGYSPEREICLCTNTSAGEMANAILAGAKSPEEISLMTAARTGCVELCHQPILHLLAAGGHAEEPKNPPSGFQWYGHSATLFQHIGADGNFSDDLVASYPKYPLDREMRDLRRLTKE
jgi:Fe-S-cluster-containing hydrogenase component 2